MKNKNPFPIDSREEIKKTANIKIRNKKYRFIYTKINSIKPNKNILKIEASVPIISLLRQINIILKEKYYECIHVYTKVKYILDFEEHSEVVRKNFSKYAYEVIIMIYTNETLLEKDPESYIHAYSFTLLDKQYHMI